MDIIVIKIFRSIRQSPSAYTFITFLLLPLFTSHVVSFSAVRFRIQCSLKKLKAEIAIGLRRFKLEIHEVQTVPVDAKICTAKFRHEIRNLIH